MKKKTMKIAVANAKGGTAKTCTTHNLAHALVNKGKRVLLCDLDPQQSLTFSVGIRPEECKISISDVLLEGYEAEKAIMKTNISDLDIIPGSLSLSSFDASVANEQDRESKLKTVLNLIEGYDFILTDCSPTLSLSVINALVGADRLLIPVVPQYLAFEGLATMMGAVDRIRSGVGDCASLLGILLTQVDYRNKATHELVKMMRKHYGRDVFKNEIRVNVRLSEAPSHGKSIFQHDWSSSGAMAYEGLTKEILTRLNKNPKTRNKNG